MQEGRRIALHCQVQFGVLVAGIFDNSIESSDQFLQRIAGHRNKRREQGCTV